jgi:hypothetical protein
MDAEFERTEARDLVLRIATILALLGAGFAAGLVFAGLVHFHPPPAKATEIMQSVKAMMAALNIYIVSFLIYVLPRGPRSATLISARSMAWFIVCSIPLASFVPYGTVLSLVAILWITIARRAQQRRLKRSAYLEPRNAS